MIIEAREDTITLRGEVKSNIWPAIQAAAALLLENHPTGIILDGTGVSHCTAKGAETFADAARYIQSHNARIVVVGLAPELLDIGKVVPGVRSQLPVALTVEEARASLKLEEITPQRGKARVAGVAPMFGNWRRAVYMADKLAVGENCEIHLVDLIKVPRSLPLGTPIPERENNGQECLQCAQSLVRETGLKSFQHAEHVRSETSGLTDFVNRLNADFAVLSVDRGEKESAHIDQTEALTLLETANFELSLIKGAPGDPSAAPRHIVVPAVGAWEHAVEHACKLASGEKAAVTVVYMIVVHRSEAIDAPKPDAEAAASDCAKEVLRIAKRYSVKVDPIVECVRDPILGFLKMFDTYDFDLAVVGVKHQSSSDYHIAQAIATEMLQELPCETVVMRVGGKEE